MSPERAKLDAIVLLHPGRPLGSVLRAAFDRMLAHREPKISFSRLEDGGAPVPTDHPAEAIVDAWESYGQSSFGVVAKGAGNTLVVVTADRPGCVQGRIALRWQFDPALIEGFVDLLADLSELMSSPLAALSHQGPGRERAGWQSRESLHRQAVRDALRPGPAQYGLCRGLAGIAHRMVLGDELVAMFGEERLASLPSELAHRRESGRWVLKTTDDPLAWSYENWCPGEAAAIEALGKEHFYDPATNALPSVVPELPEFAPYPCRTRDLETNEWVEHNP